jgi:hypothetical protein
VVEQRLLLVDVGFLALDRVEQVCLALGGQLGRDQPAADCVDAQAEARDEGDYAGCDDDG